MTEKFRPFITPENRRKPLKQKYRGFEIEKRFVLLTKEEDHTKRKNGLTLYDSTLIHGKIIKQGYIKDFMLAVAMLGDLGINLVEEFKPNTVRLRKYGTKYYLTLKDKKDTKTREVEWRLTSKEFNTYWPLTKGSRIFKKRWEQIIRKMVVEYDAYMDRLLLKAEIEVETEKDLEKCPILGMDVTNDNSWSNKALSK